jgi:zinc protease
MIAIPPYIRRVCAAAFIAALCFNAHAAFPPGMTQGPSVEGITEYDLANGLRVLLFPDASQAKTTVNITYLVGSRMENYGETGMAHLLEHMVFKGTPSRGNIMSALGQRGMDFNGSTWLDRTNYFETFPASDDNLDYALGMEADRMVNSFIARKDLDSEMTVVRNEMENNENNAVRILIQRTTAAAYDWHSYGKDTIGARSDVELVDIARLQAFYHLYYQPDNAVLVIAGAFDPDKVLSLVSKYFGPIPKPSRVLPRLYTEEPVQDGERQVTLRRVGDTQWLADLYHTVPAAHPDAVAIEAAVAVMTVTPGGRLYQALVEAKKATSVDDFVYNGHDPGFAIFLVNVPNQDPIDTAREVMLRTVEGIKARPVSVAELDRVRIKALQSIDDSINNPQRLGIALSQSIAEGDWRLFFLRRDQWRKVTPADVDRVATAYFKPANRTIGAFIPDASPERSPSPPTVDVAAMVKDYKGDAAVAAGETFDATPANLDARAQRFTLANGMKVVLLPKKTRGETVQFALRLHYGDEKSIFGLEGEGDLTGEMMMRGTARHSRQEIEDTLDRLRAKLSVGGSQTGASARGQTVGADLAPTLDLLAEIMREPSFPAAELETLKREDIAELEEGRSDPRSIAVRALGRYENPYPAGDSRYTPTLDEAIKRLQTPGVDALRSFHRRFYGGAPAEIAVVGDFDAPAVKAQLERLFGDWKSPSVFTRVPEPLVDKRASAMPFETPDKANAFLTGSTSFALTDRDQDYPAFLLANYLLGGSTNSRLWIRVRQKEGLSYGVGSSFRASSFEPNSALSISAIFAPQNLQPLRTAVHDELKRAVTEGFSAAEVEDGKRAMLQERKLSRARDAGLAEALTQQAYLGRTFAFSGEIDAAIARLTPEAINAAARKYLQPDAFAFVFAGDFAKAGKKVVGAR